jgi:hypothetical protein
LSRQHYLLSFSQQRKCGWENIWREIFYINHLNNVSSNFFQNMMSGSADDKMATWMSEVWNPLSQFHLQQGLRWGCGHLFNSCQAWMTECCLHYMFLPPGIAPDQKCG